MRINVLIVCILWCFTQTLGQSVYIVIHGTWGADCDWYIPGGDFFDAFEKTNQHHHNATSLPFRWSGSHKQAERERAAQSLAQLIQTYRCNNVEVNLVGHSHGGTVALLASHLLDNDSINTVYTLGMPVDNTLFPNMNAIRYCYNLFSFEDPVQPVFGMFGREHTPHERVANIRVVIEGKEPNHCELHHGLVGKWLSLLHQTCVSYCENNKKNMSDPGIISFYHTMSPTYEIDIQRKDLSEKDSQLSKLVLNSLRQSLDIGSRIPLTKR